MLSWKLWRALNRPPRHHPLFQYVLTHAKKEETKVTSGFFMWLFMFTIIAFFWTIIFDWLSYLLLVLLILWNTVYSLRWTLRISATISGEKEENRYDLLASMPFGMLGTSWAISTGCVHRRSSFRWMPYLVQVSAIVVASTMLFSVGITSLAMSSTNNEALRLANFDLLYLGTAMIPFLILFYFDHIYSILTSILIGMVATVDVRYRNEARIRALLGFLMLQMLIYAFCALFAIWALPRVFSFFGLGGMIALYWTSGLGMLLFFILREWLIKRMWDYLIQNLNTESGEAEWVLNPHRS